MSKHSKASKICNSTRVDSKYGNDENPKEKLNTLDNPFATITAAIEAIHKYRNPTICSKWIIFIDPCVHKEDIELRPFIDLHGLDREGTIIQGIVNASKLTNSSDEVEIKELTIRGYIQKPVTSKGILSVFDIIIFDTLEVNNRSSTFDIAAGSFMADSCAIFQNSSSTKDSTIYRLHSASHVEIVVRNCRHERIITSKVRKGTLISNFLISSTNDRTNVTSKSNIFLSRFSRKFKGLLIPYNCNLAAGNFNSHSDTLNHIFEKGAGTGLLPPIDGQTYNNAFILLRKIAAEGKNLETHIHTANVIGLPENILNTFTSVHTRNSGRAKTKHVGWQGFQEIPEVFIIDDENSITVRDAKEDKSLTGAASDAKLYAGRLTLSTLTIIDLPLNPPLGPVVNIAADVGFVNVEQAPTQLFLPTGLIVTPGQQVTFRFEAPGPTLISLPPSTLPPNITFSLQDTSLPSSGKFTAIVYTPLGFRPSPSIYNAPSTGFIINAASVMFTLYRETRGNNINYIWKGVTTHRLPLTFGTGQVSILVPEGATSITILATGGGGAGALPVFVGQSQIGDAIFYLAGGGGGSAGTFLLTTSVAGIGSITANVGAGATDADPKGGDTTISIGDLTLIAGGGFTGAQTQLVNRNPPNTIGGGGGAGGVVSVQGGGPLPPGITIINGVSGGGAGVLEVATFTAKRSTGFPGSDEPVSGNKGGAGGFIDTSIVLTANVGVRGPGGGGASFLSPGATPPSLTIVSSFPETIFSISNRGASPLPNSGAGGAENFYPPAPVYNGSDGGLYVFFQ